jgi:hypothetical protein
MNAYALLDSLVSFLWSPIEDQFNRSCGEMRTVIRAFESEARVNMDERNMDTNQIAHQLLSRTDSPPRNDIPVVVVPFPESPCFVGRQESMERLHENLMNHSTHRSCTIHGIGGMGKTQLAKTYALQYKDFYEYVFWVNAESTPALAESFNVIADRLSIPDEVGTEKRWRIEQVSRHLGLGRVRGLSVSRMNVLTLASREALAPDI